MLIKCRDLGLFRANNKDDVEREFNNVYRNGVIWTLKHNWLLPSRLFLSEDNILLKNEYSDSLYYEDKWDRNLDVKEHDEWVQKGVGSDVLLVNYTKTK